MTEQHETNETPYRLQEGRIPLPHIERDASINEVYFTNEQGEPRQMIVTREKLKPGADLAGTVEKQSKVLRKEIKGIQIGEPESFTLTARQWPALQLPVVVGKNENRRWQLHTSIQTGPDTLMTISLVSAAPLTEEEIKTWTQRLDTFETWEP